MKSKTINLTRLLVLMMLIFFALLLFSCSSDNENNINNVEEEALEKFTTDYFTILGSTFVNDDLPSLNSDNLNITGIIGNSTLLAGGSNYVTVEGFPATEVN